MPALRRTYNKIKYKPCLNIVSIVCLFRRQHQKEPETKQDGNNDDGKKTTKWDLSTKMRSVPVYFDMLREVCTIGIQWFIVPSGGICCCCCCPTSRILSISCAFSFSLVYDWNECFVGSAQMQPFQRLPTLCCVCVCACFFLCRSIVRHWFVWIAAQAAEALSTADVSSRFNVPTEWVVENIRIVCVSHSLPPHAWRKNYHFFAFPCWLLAVYLPVWYAHENVWNWFGN